MVCNTSSTQTPCTVLRASIVRGAHSLTTTITSRAALKNNLLADFVPPKVGHCGDVVDAVPSVRAVPAGGLVMKHCVARICLRNAPIDEQRVVVPRAFIGILSRRDDVAVLLRVLVARTRLTVVRQLIVLKTPSQPHKCDAVS